MNIQVCDDVDAKIDFFSSLPPELSLHVLSYLDVQSLYYVALCCTTYHEFAYDNVLWMFCVDRDFPFLKDSEVARHGFLLLQKNSFNRTNMFTRDEVCNMFSEYDMFLSTKGLEYDVASEMPDWKAFYLYLSRYLRATVQYLPKIPIETTIFVDLPLIRRLLRMPYAIDLEEMHFLAERYSSSIECIHLCDDGYRLPAETSYLCLSEDSFHFHQSLQRLRSLKKLNNLTHITIIKAEETAVVHILSSIPSKSVIEVVLDGCRLKSEVGSILSTFVSLERFLAFDCDGGEILNDIPTMRSLKELDISDSDVDHLPGSMGELIHLEHLNVGYSRISKLPDSLRYCTNLLSLNLSRGLLENIAPPLFAELVKLERIDLSFNKIDALPDTIGKLRNLKVFILRSTGLSSVPDSIGELISLEELYLSGNRIEVIPPSISKLGFLRIFEIDEEVTMLPEVEKTLLERECEMSKLLHGSGSGILRI